MNGIRRNIIYGDEHRAICESLGKVRFLTIKLFLLSNKVYSPEGESSRAGMGEGKTIPRTATLPGAGQIRRVRC
jgi:hypothetical protein